MNLTKEEERRRQEQLTYYRQLHGMYQTLREMASSLQDPKTKPLHFAIKHAMGIAERMMEEEYERYIKEWKGKVSE